MSCDDPAPKGECAEVLRDVWLFLDDEMDADRRAAVQHHLDDCSPCLVEAGLDQKLKSLLHSKCGGDRAPEQLRARLAARLATVRFDAEGVEISTTSMVVTAEGSAERSA
ncbi:mycothiol system anti-sigma-R factor [Nakamurella endophytica]|uniref:Mycothiol system anti-sigma-R factor n=1 Tax=Nakamurella endophytica TaxID=1748367 RepID=A0A917SLN9_9ACTN|nr:mycothiol system anti-sigma-R factor [Nakamurella endophytica]GGL85828.1 mycothiol system anti-sigma-R factor [Nakamurella endophytica]